MEGTKKIKSMSFHQYSWNSEVETTWISLIGWHHKTSNTYLVTYLGYCRPNSFEWYYFCLAETNLAQSSKVCYGTSPSYSNWLGVAKRPDLFSPGSCCSSWVFQVPKNHPEPKKVTFTLKSWGSKASTSATLSFKSLTNSAIFAKFLEATKGCKVSENAQLKMSFIRSFGQRGSRRWHFWPSWLYFYSS